MDPWVIDADEMQASQLSEFKSNLLHPTKAIKRFLEASNNSTTIVVAPKGFGKTLLLKAKRLSLQNDSLTILPSGQALLDKPSGSPTVQSAKEYGDSRDNPGYWRSLWTISIAIAVLKLEDFSSEGLSPFIAKLLNNNIRSPCDIFDAVLSASYAQYQSCLEDYNDYIIPSMRDVRHAVVVFIDNIDEYYEEMLRAQNTHVGYNMYGEAKDAYWYLAQLGVALAARELHEINPHIRVYAAMRREVLQRSVTGSAFGLQLTGRSIIIEYSDSDLKDIIDRNITNEPTANLVKKNADDPLACFIGPDSLRIFHPKTGDEENFRDFWIRHTLRRPRDVISIGRRISDLEPGERNLRTLRLAVRAGSGEIVRAYMAEMEPHLSGFDPDLIVGLLPKNTLTLEEMSDISRGYAAAYIEKHGVSGRHTEHVFCALYKIGLLGYVGHDFETGSRTQIFNKPGSLSLDDTNILPEADVYLVHPTLDDLISARRPKYFSRLNELNIVGLGRDWRDERAISYVLKGDLRGYSAIMRDVPKAQRFGQLLRAAMREYCEGIDYSKISDGDSILLIDSNPVSVITAARQLEERMVNSEFECSFRFGGEAGYILLEGNGATQVPSGLAIRAAARIEPHVAPGEIWVTDEFSHQLSEQFKTRIYAFEPIKPDEASGLEVRDDKFNLAKNAHDETLLTSLFRVRPD